MTTTDVRRLALVLLALWAGAVCYLTLTPAGHTPPLTLRGFFCIACGELDGSDMLRNWVLFLPGGLLAAAAFPGWRSLVVPLGLSALVELVQIGVPGRDPAAQDLVLNALGAASGALVMRRGLPSWARRLVPAAAVAAWLAPAVLLVPLTTDAELWGQWTPRFGNRTHYDGRILRATVGGLSVESWKFEDEDALGAALVERRPVELRLEVGPAPASWAPLFQVVDGEQRAVLELGQIRTDLVLRGRNPARVLLLDQPDVRWPGAVSGLAPGDTVTVVVERGRGSVCMSVAGRERCGLAPSLADGWAHVLNLEGPPEWFRELLSLGWALGLGGLIGLTLRSPRAAVALAVASAAAGYAASVVSPDVSPSVVHGAVLVAGTLAGAPLRGPLVRLWHDVRPA